MYIYIYRERDIDKVKHYISITYYKYCKYKHLFMCFNVDIFTIYFYYIYNSISL